MGTAAIRKRRKAFSLVEVVLALGIAAFSGMTLLSLFSLGMESNRESREQLEAAHIAKSVFSVRRASPLAEIPGCLLPPLDGASEVALTEPVYLDSMGRLLPSVVDAQFAAYYRIEPRPSGQSSQVYLCLYWPAAVPAVRAAGRFEMFTVMALP